MSDNLTFTRLVDGIAQVDRTAVLAAGRRSHQLLSLRNWLIGTWIVTFEQGGSDRAAYGERLLPRLSEALRAGGTKGMSARNLANFRMVALAYPSLDAPALGATTAAQLPSLTGAEILQAPARSASTVAELPWRDTDWVLRLFCVLTFTHLVEFARIEDRVERAFYELHSLKRGLVHSRADPPARHHALPADRARHRPGCGPGLGSGRACG